MRPSKTLWPSSRHRQQRSGFSCGPEGFQNHHVLEGRMGLGSHMCRRVMEAQPCPGVDFTGRRPEAYRGAKPTASGVACQPRAHPEFQQGCSAMARCFPLPPQSRSESQPDPAGEVDQHPRRFAESEIAAPAPGPPENLQITECDLRDPSAKEVRVKVLATCGCLPDVQARYGLSPFGRRLNAGSPGAAKNGPGERHGRHAARYGSGVGRFGSEPCRLGCGRLCKLHVLPVDALNAA